MSVIVYTKDGCHLCENVVSTLHKIHSEKSFELSLRDITSSKELFERFRNIIPVVEIDGKIRLAGSVLANRHTLEDVLRRSLFQE